MERDKYRILLTGPPGIGKTTLVRKVTADLAHRHPVGFYTSEIREGGARKGFELVSLEGRRGTLSHVDVRGSLRVGKYGVDVAGFDEFLDTIHWLAQDAGLIVIDEIGKMECFSEKFRSLVRRIMKTDTHVLATVARRGSGLIAQVKQRRDVELLEITARNRNSLPGDIVSRLS